MTTPELLFLPAGLRWRTEFAPQHGEGEGPTPGKAKTPAKAKTTTPDGKGSTEKTDDKKKPPSFQDACMDQWPLLLIMLVAFWFLLLRPQMKQEKTQKALQANLRKGDSVVSNSGIHGRIESIDEKTITIVTDKEGRTQITFDRAAINRKISDEGAAATPAETDKK